MDLCMRVSLIVPTMNRPELLTRLFDSLCAQTRAADEVIVVDQSIDDRTEEAVKDFSSRLNMILLKAAPRGISAAKNAGLRAATGAIVAFPDDDCWYPEDVIRTVLSTFEADEGLDVFTGKSVNESGKPSQGRWAETRRDINRYNVWTTQTSYTTFYRRRVFDIAGSFNEELGVGSGSPWGAGEETNLLIYALDGGARAVYDPNLRISHPEPLETYDQKAMLRGCSYNRGFGRVMKIAGYPLWFVLYMSLRPIAGAVVSVARLRFGRSNYQLAAGYYRFRGWLHQL
jgi:glycosyltransferase involved in cell wall biosynthesis